MCKMTDVYAEFFAALFVNSEILETRQTSINRGLLRYNRGYTHTMEHEEHAKKLGNPCLYGKISKCIIK